MLAGCEIFPYVMEPETPSSPTLTGTSVQPTQTQAILTATLEATPTKTSTPLQPTPTTIAVDSDLTNQTFIYKLQDGNPFFLSNFAHPETGCEWMGIAGQVFNTEGIEVQDLVIIVGDTQIAEEYQWTAQTGQVLFYGPGGYEIQLSDTPQETTERFWVQVNDQNGVPLSERLFFDTVSDCSGNLILLNFVFIESSQEKAMPTSTLAPYP